MLNLYFKKYKVQKKDFAKYIKYTPQGLTKALKSDKKQHLLEIALLVMILERKGIKLKDIIEALEESRKETE